ncbi:FAD-dependent monooxygenase [Antarcticimicrobium sediminis]|uniref:FAD-binding protein n=1 Tax=Antarcticimicrobium sediminis TaxID=2546227 RepID=A0A4V6PGA4_9RHOB|nr:FAD-dependent monooxygenase [Antarcticimicrobium sediminis]TDE40706.1 FAD-binding protein [Antarcticimicrobium sediminis]
MALTGRNIIVAGAGIGGLAAALALRARGAEVTVLEQACEITEVGAGLQISPNGVAVLRALGLEQDLARVATPSRAVVLRDYRRPGEVLRLDLARHAPDQAFYLVHRADLIDLLVRAVRAADIPLRLLQRVDRVVPGPVPELHLANGAQARADLVVGADGLSSRMRLALNGADRPFFTGQVAWRATVPNTLNLPPEAQIFMGPGRHLVCYPLRDGKLVNIVAVQERKLWADEGWHHSDDPDNLRAAFADFRGLPSELLAQVREVALWGLFRHPVAEHWHGEGVAILGDAAHPTLPFLAQGANLALEDGWVLADCLAAQKDQAAALASYQARRRDRAARVIAAANGNAWKYHFKLSPLREIGHLALRVGGALAPARAVRQFDWLYGYDVTA